MKQYLLSMYQPDGGTPPPEVLGPIMAGVTAWRQALRDAGAWVFTARPHPPSTATVLTLRGGDVVCTDGPYTEGKEHIGGFTIIKAADLDAALEWGRRLTRITTLPTEVRPLHDEPAA